MRSLTKVDWTDRFCIEILLHNYMSSFDDDSLTRLVFLAHDHCMRVEVSAARNDILRVLFHSRDPGGDDLYTRHPSLEEAVSYWRQYHPDPQGRSKKKGV